MLIMPSNVPCMTNMNQSSSTYGLCGAIMAKAPIRSRQMAIIISRNGSSLSTRNPPMAAPMKKPMLLPETALDISS